MLSRDWMEPGMFGILQPVLIWPEGLSERLDDDHIEAVMIHEIAHAKRKDNLTAALHMLVEAAFWFHPLVWWMERRMVEERERACDEAVVEMGSRPGVYAESLLKAVRFCVESPLVCVAGVTGADLNRRVRSIMTLRQKRLA
jgi:beta-lactamase regulating signal transducer with metallopeptidase domain